MYVCPGLSIFILAAGFNFCSCCCCNAIKLKEMIGSRLMIPLIRNFCSLYRRFGILTFKTRVHFFRVCLPDKKSWIIILPP